MADTLFSLTGKVALITGASRGIGLSIAEAYVAAGAKVVIASRKQEGLDLAVKQIEEERGQVIAIPTHTGDEDAVNSLVSKAIDEFGGIDILVNNAATNPHFGPILTAERSHWKKIFDVNLMGYFLVAKACVKSMRQRGGGKIINMASVAGKTPLPGMGIYCVSKAGVIMLTEVLAVELAPENIQVNAIAPGFVKTKFSQAIWDNTEIHQATLKMIPQNRMASPEEIVGSALYLASDASSFATGATLVVDGGQLLGSSF